MRRAVFAPLLELTDGRSLQLINSGPVRTERDINPYQTSTSEVA
jgi:hypothetical protein